MEQGTVKWFNEGKGFGFISTTAGNDLFVHCTAIVGGGTRVLTKGESVQFEVERGPKGPRASRVLKLHDAQHSGF